MNETKFVIEDRYYYADAPAELESAIIERVNRLEDGIISYLEIPKTTPYSMKFTFIGLKAMAATMNECGFLLDLTQTLFPDSKTRRYINKEFRTTLSNVKHVSFVTGKNVVLNTIAKFVMYQTGLNSYSVVKTREEGIEDIKRALNV